MTPPIEIVEPPLSDEDTEVYEPDQQLPTVEGEDVRAFKENADGEPALATPAHQ